VEPARRHLLHVFATLAVGGPQVRFAALARRFAARWRHTLFAMDANYAAETRLDSSVAHARLDLGVDKRRGLANLAAFSRAIRATRADVLITYNWGAIEWAMANRLWPRLRHVHIEDGFGPEEAGGQLARRVLFRRLALGGGMTRIVVPSLVLHDHALNTWKLDRARVDLIANGIDVARFASASAERPYGDRVVVTVAALRAEKNLGRLLRAFAPLDGADRLVIVGDGPERAALEGEAARLGLGPRVVFAGAHPRPEAILAAADVFALSSDTEQMPLSVIEAMAAGLPIAGLAVGDVARMVAPENRPFIAAPGDEAGLGGAMKTLLDDRARARAIGAANQAKARAEFDQETMFTKYAAIFD
jgi:glycosyltransferase involved in cell wall biosynthesis